MLTQGQYHTNGILSPAHHVRLTHYSLYFFTSLESQGGVLRR